MPPGQTEGWLVAERLDELARRRVFDIAIHSTTKGLAPDVAFDRFVGGGYQVHCKEFDELGTVPLETWDVFDDDTAVYQLWLYAADGGVLYKDGTTEAVGGMVQGHLDPYELEPERLAELEVARAKAVDDARNRREFPCELSHYRFGRS